MQRKTTGDASWRPVVAVPARNEAERLPHLFDALAAQTWLQGQERRLLVSIVLNNCTDGSLSAVDRARERHPNLDIHALDVVWTSQAHVGRARRLAMEVAIARGQGLQPVVVFTTDADAKPARDWLQATLCAIAEGADAVGGLIIGDPLEEALLGPDFQRRAAIQLHYDRLTDRLASLVDPAGHDPWPRHRDHTGASLAVRADVYAAVGGLPALPFREDLALVSRIRAAGYRLVHPLSVQVGVSARLDGRAPGGMADCLRNWMREEAEGKPHTVEDPQDTLTRLQMRHAMRDGTLHASARIERLAADDPDATGLTPIGDAIVLLNLMIAEMEGLHDAA